MNQETYHAQRRVSDLLRAEQLRSGEFPVLIAPRGELSNSGVLDSTPFATALIIRLLHGIALPDLKDTIATALSYITDQQLSQGTWRYWDKSHPRHSQIPPDADTTSCCALALKLHGRLHVPPTPVLLSNRHTDGRFLTWLLKNTGSNGTSDYTPFWVSTEANPDDCDIGVNLNVLSYLNDPTVTHEVVPDWLESCDDSEDRWYVGPCTIPVFVLLLQQSTEVKEPAIHKYLRQLVERLDPSCWQNSLLTQAQLILLRQGLGMKSILELEQGFLRSCLTIDTLVPERLYCGGASRSVEFGSGAVTAAYMLRALGSLGEVVDLDMRL